MHVRKKTIMNFENLIRSLVANNSATRDGVEEVGTEAEAETGTVTETSGPSIDSQTVPLQKSHTLPLELMKSESLARNDEFKVETPKNRPTRIGKVIYQMSPSLAFICLIKDVDYFLKWRAHDEKAPLRNLVRDYNIYVSTRHVSTPSPIVKKDSENTSIRRWDLLQSGGGGLFSHWVSSYTLATPSPPLKPSHEHENGQENGHEHENENENEQEQFTEDEIELLPKLTRQGIAQYFGETDYNPVFTTVMRNGTLIDVRLPSSNTAKADQPSSEPINNSAPSSSGYPKSNSGPESSKGP